MQLTGLVPGQTYMLAVSAVSGAGNGPWSPDLAARTEAGWSWWGEFGAMAGKGVGALVWGWGRVGGELVSTVG